MHISYKTWHGHVVISLTKRTCIIYYLHRNIVCHLHHNVIFQFIFLSCPRSDQWPLEGSWWLSSARRLSASFPSGVSPRRPLAETSTLSPGLPGPGRSRAGTRGRPRPGSCCLPGSSAPGDATWGPLSKGGTRTVGRSWGSPPRSARRFDQPYNTERHRSGGRAEPRNSTGKCRTGTGWTSSTMIWIILSFLVGYAICLLPVAWSPGVLLKQSL